MFSGKNKKKDPLHNNELPILNLIKLKRHQTALTEAEIKSRDEMNKKRETKIAKMKQRGMPGYIWHNSLYEQATPTPPSSKPKELKLS